MFLDIFLLFLWVLDSPTTTEAQSQCLPMLAHSPHMQMTLKSLYPTPGSVSGKALNSLIQVFIVLPWYHDSIACSNSQRQQDCVCSEDQCVCSEDQCVRSVRTSSVRVPATSAKWLAKFTWAPPVRKPEKSMCESGHRPVDHLTPWAFEEETDACVRVVYWNLGGSHLVCQACKSVWPSTELSLRNKIIFILLI